MKRKFLPLLAGIASIAILAAPIAAIAESPTLVAQQNASSNNPFEQLGISDTQKKQMQEIWQTTTQQLGQIVTPAQQQRFLTARKNGKSIQEARAAMQLSADQKRKISQILQSANQRSLSVLTPAQIEQLKNLRTQQSQP